MGKNAAVRITRQQFLRLVAAGTVGAALPRVVRAQPSSLSRCMSPSTRSPRCHDLCDP
jgi:hypothetical protein